MLPIKCLSFIIARSYRERGGSVPFIFSVNSICWLWLLCTTISFKAGPPQTRSSFASNISRLDYKKSIIARAKVSKSARRLTYITFSTFTPSYTLRAVVFFVSSSQKSSSWYFHSHSDITGIYMGIKGYYFLYYTREGDIYFLEVGSSGRALLMVQETDWQRNETWG